MKDNEKCVILSKKEYNELRSQSNIPRLNIVIDFDYRWRDKNIHVGGTLDPSEKLYCQIRRICSEIFEKTHEIVKEYGDERLSILDEALNIINVFENLPWWKRIFYKPNYFKQ